MKLSRRWFCALLLTVVSPGETAAQSRVADSLWRAGDTKRAVPLYEARLADDAHDGVALHRLGLARAWERRFDESLALFDRLIELEPGNLDARLDRSKVFAWRGDTRRAIAAVDSLLISNPAHAPSLHARARYAAWGGDLHSAELQWRAALRPDSAGIPALVGLSETLRWQGRPGAARSLVEGAPAWIRAHPDVVAELAIVRQMTAPRLSPGYTIERDSDGNRMRTAAGSVAYFPSSRLEARIGAYHRALRDATHAGAGALNAYGADAAAAYELWRGWSLSGGLGASDLTDIDRAPVLSARAALRAPAWLPYSGGLSYTRAATDYTAVLAERGVRTDQIILDTNIRLSPLLNVSAEAAATRFSGAEPNLRMSGMLGASRRMTSSLSLGLAARAFTFEKDRTELSDGYFNPDFFGTIEATAAARGNSGLLSFSVDVAPGIQQIGTDGEVGGSFRAGGRAAYSFAAGRQIGVSAAYAKSGANQFSPTGGPGYSYSNLAVFSSWMF